MVRKMTRETIETSLMRFVLLLLFMMSMWGAYDSYQYEVKKKETIKTFEAIWKKRNAEQAKIFLAEETENKPGALRLEKEAKDRGWKIERSVDISNKHYTVFLEDLLKTGEVVDTGKLKIIVADKVGGIITSPYAIRVDGQGNVSGFLSFLRKYLEEKAQKTERVCVLEAIAASFLFC